MMPIKNKFSLFVFIAGIFYSCHVAEAGEKVYPQIDASTTNLTETVEFLSSLNPARNYLNPESLNRAAKFIKRQFVEYGYKPVEQSFITGEKGYRNIIASYGPLDAPRFIVGAHYDVCDFQPGADDNASGVAGLLEIARLVMKKRPTLPYRIDFVAFTLEEPPFFRTDKMGSFVHAKSLYDSDVDVLGMISLEMIGYFTDKPKSQKYPLGLLKLFYPAKGDFIALVGRFKDSALIRQLKKKMNMASAIKVRTIRAPSFITGVDFSDHLNYWRFGYRAAMITDTGFYRNPNYHEKSDTIDTLNFEMMKEVVKGTYWTLVNLELD